MDIYSFIDSKDIRAHCRNLEYQFTPLESVFLIWQSEKTLAEKHEAYRSIIDTTEEQSINGRLWTEQVSGLHDFLEKYMECETLLLKKFYKKEDGTVYIAKLKFDGIWEHEGYHLYTSAKECMEAIVTKYDDVLEYAISKVWLKKDRTITVYFESDNCPKRISEQGNLKLQRDEIFHDSFEEMWVEVPTPFRKGDIVYDPNGTNRGYYPTAEPFVLLDLCTWGDEENLKKRKARADASDMTATGYFLIEDSTQIYGECMHEYLRLEFYTKPLEGKQRILQALSALLKGEIDAELFGNACQIFAFEEAAKKIRDRLECYTKEGLQKIGLDR